MSNFICLQARLAEAYNYLTLNPTLELLSILHMGIWVSNSMGDSKESIRFGLVLWFVVVVPIGK